MQKGDKKFQYLNNDSTKELALTRNVMNSLAIFVYSKMACAPVSNTVDILSLFNEWSAETSKKFESAQDVCSILEYIRKLTNVNKTDLRKAVREDGLFTDLEEIYYD